MDDERGGIIGTRDISVNELLARTLILALLRRCFRNLTISQMVWHIATCL